MATAINYTSTSQTGKKLNKTVTNVNPNNTSTQLKTFAQMLNSLTTNHYGATTRIDKDELVAASSLTAPTILLSHSNKTPVTNPIIWTERDAEALDFGLATDSPGKVYLISAPEYSSANPIVYPEAAEYFETPPPENYHFWDILLGVPAKDAKCLGEFVFGIKAAEGFAPATFTVTVSAS